MKLTQATLEAQRMIPPDLEPEQLRNLCLDKGYDYEAVRMIVAAWGYVGHIPPRDESKRIIHDIPNYRARRWVVERAHSWMNRFRRLLEARKLLSLAASNLCLYCYTGNTSFRIGS